MMSRTLVPAGTKRKKKRPGAFRLPTVSVFEKSFLCDFNEFIKKIGPFNLSNRGDQSVGFRSERAKNKKADPPESPLS